MRERGIPEEAIDWVLANYDISRPGGHHGDSRQKTVYVGQWQGRKLMVVVGHDTTPPKIITAAWED